MPISKAKSTSSGGLARVEWPTLILFVLTYGGWVGISALHAQLPLLLVLVLMSLLVTLHSSLQHEVIHGHPTPWFGVNNALAFPSLGLVVPYQRYELLHLQHHRNWLLTDPYDDSESYFVPRLRWLNSNSLLKMMLNFNNTLSGRLLIGPFIMIVRMFKNEYKSCKLSSDARKSWMWHLLSVTPVIMWLVYVDFSLLLYALAVTYPAISLLMLRAFSEHIPETDFEQRSAIIKTNWFMQLLYLNNNYHRVHHAQPELAWYRLPQAYRRDYAHHTQHVYQGYYQLFKQYGFKQRYTVDHPFLARD